MFDSDGDGKITIDELKTVFNARKLGSAESEEEVWSYLMNQADEDNDGTLSKDEFFRAMG